MPVAPKACADEHNLPGPILAAAGIVAIALALTAVGYGSLTWSGLCALASVLCLRFGIGLMVLEHRRAKAEKWGESASQSGI
ncbi:hypothetical protein [Nocardia yunnanensis]|nr:hypothetical protein [Nocardia yunnanensis]